jgi:hypothetical protein
VTESLEARIHDAVPDATTFLSGASGCETRATPTRTCSWDVLLVDGWAILVSTNVPDTHEQTAIFGGGFRNGLVVMARRLLAQGLLPKRDPQAE